MSRARIALVTAVCCLLSPAIRAQETYIVEPGDTLIGLASHFGTTVEAITAANNLSSTNLIVGEILSMPQTNTYVVQPGDNLSNIAATNGLAVEELMALNNLSDTALIIGQELKLKAASASSELKVDAKSGDSLWSLADEYGVSVNQLAAANNLTLGDSLDLGQQLTIPGVYADAASTDQGGGAEPSITVASGDSLSEIAARHGTTVDALMSLNHLDSDVVNAGATLYLPPAASVEEASGIIWPLEGIITSYFGPRNLLGMTYHYGLDIDGVTGDPIQAAMGGTVTYSGWLGGYGYCVIIEADGVEYYYGHASELDVQVGDEVATGQVIAKVGATGRVTGSHLHFEIRMNGQAVDPLPYLERMASLP